MYTDYLTELYIGDSVELSVRMLQRNSYLTILTIPYTATAVPGYVAHFCYRLKAFIVPRNVTSVGERNAYYLGSYSIENAAVVSLPETVENLGPYFAYGCPDIWRVVLPGSIATLSNSVQSCENLRRVFLSDTISDVGGLCYQCFALREIKLPRNLVTVGSDAFYKSGVIDLVLPETVTTISGYLGSYSALKRLVVKGEITSVGHYNLNSAYLTELIVCTQTTINSAISELVTKAGSYRRLYVPDEAVTAYTNALSSDYKQRIYPLSSYTGIIPED